MILPGSRYQEHGWERVKSLLADAGRAALHEFDSSAFAQASPEADCLAFVELMATCVMEASLASKKDTQANHVGDSPLALAQYLVAECSQYPALFMRHSAKIRGLPRIGSKGRGAKVNTLIEQYFLELRDEVDAREIGFTTGAPWSANKLWVYRKIDETWHKLCRLFANPVVAETRPLIEAILRRPLEVGVTPIEAAHVQRRRSCRPEWIIRWSEAQREWMHNSKAAQGWRTRPDRIAAVLGELADGDEIHAPGGKVDVYGERAPPGSWLDDYDRVLDASERHDPVDQSESDALPEAEPGWDPWSPEALAAAPDNESWSTQAIDNELISSPDKVPDDIDSTAEPGLDVCRGDPGPAFPSTVPETSQEVALGLPPGYILVAQRTEETASELYELLSSRCSLWTRMQMYRQLIGAADPSYPDRWLLPSTRCLPTQSQLAALEGVSVPTFVRRVKAALVVLEESTLGLTRRKS